MKKQGFGQRALLLLLSAVLSFGFVSCADGNEGSQGKITDLFVDTSEIILSVGEENRDGYITVGCGGDFSAEDIVFHSDNKGVATVRYQSTKGRTNVYYTVSGVGLGTAEIYFTANDSAVESEKIKVTVTDSESSEESEEISEEESSQEEVSTKDPVKESSVEKPSEAPPVEKEPSEASKTVSNEQMVWIPQTGKKYHSHASCSGMKNPTEVTISEAKNRGYTPCKRCYG